VLSDKGSFLCDKGWVVRDKGSRALCKCEIGAESR
jgi:hypothetical protein